MQDNKDIGHLLRKRLEQELSGQEKGPSLENEWADIRPQVIKDNFFQFGFTHFNIFYITTVLSIFAVVSTYFIMTKNRLALEAIPMLQQPAIPVIQPDSIAADKVPATAPKTSSLKQVYTETDSLPSTADSILIPVEQPIHTEPQKKQFLQIPVQKRLEISRPDTIVTTDTYNGSSERKKFINETYPLSFYP